MEDITVDKPDEEPRSAFDENMSRSDMVLIQNACSSNYDIPDDELKQLPAMLCKILNNKNTSERTRISAAKTLLMVRKHALEQVRLLNDMGIMSIQDNEIRAVRTPLPGPRMSKPVVVKEIEEGMDDEESEYQDRS